MQTKSVIARKTWREWILFRLAFFLQYLLMTTAPTSITTYFTEYAKTKRIYQDNYKFSCTTLFNNQNLANLLSGRSYSLENSHLICCVCRRTVFYAEGMSTDRIFWAGYTGSFFVNLVLSLLTFLRLLLITFKYSICLAFYSALDYAFPMCRG